MSWHKAYELIKPYMMRIETESGFGTGFLFTYSSNNSLAAIATACHVIEDADDWKKPLKIRHYATGKVVYFESKDRVILKDRGRDTATIIIASGKFDLPKVTLPLLPSDKIKKIGVELGWTGFPSLSPTDLCFFSGAVSFYQQSDDSYLIDGVAINGVSGGPVFSTLADESPQIVGVISAYISNRREGGNLPGLLKARDLTTLHEHIQSFKSLDEAKEKEDEVEKEMSDEAQAAGSPAKADEPREHRPPKKKVAKKVARTKKPNG